MDSLQASSSSSKKGTEESKKIAKTFDMLERVDVDRLDSNSEFVKILSSVYPHFEQGSFEKKNAVLRSFFCPPIFMQAGKTAVKDCALSLVVPLVKAASVCAKDKGYHTTIGQLLLLNFRPENTALFSGVRFPDKDVDTVTSPAIYGTDGEVIINSIEVLVPREIKENEYANQMILKMIQVKYILDHYPGEEKNVTDIIYRNTLGDDDNTARQKFELARKDVVEPVKAAKTRSKKKAEGSGTESDSHEATGGEEKVKAKKGKGKKEKSSLPATHFNDDEDIINVDN